MNFLEKLLGGHDTVERDDSWPVETSEYYEDVSVNNYYMPPVQTDQWAPTADQTIPYRGVEEHGVPYNATNAFVVPIAQGDAEPDEPSVDYEVQTTIDPIPVNVVSMPLPHNRENRLATSQWTVVRGADPIRVAGQRLNRTRLVVTCVGLDQVLFSTDKQYTKNGGMIVAAVSGAFTINSSDDIWAYAPTSLATDPILYVMEEYSVETNERPV